MTGPGDEKAAGGSGRGRHRPSHADREQVIDALKAAFIQGRLTRDEFDLRVGRALRSQTYAGLAALTVDLPAGLTGPPAHDALQADIRFRRRRAPRIAKSLAVIAVIAATISVAAVSHRPAALAPPRPAGAVMYVVAPSGVIPVATATNTLGRPIKIGAIPAAIAITPNGRTAYIADGNYRTVTPVATATNSPGRPIKIGGYPAAIAITPDGKAAYVVSYSPKGTTVTPVSTATNTPGKPIKISSGFPRAVAIAITPDGRTAYVVRASARRTTVTPVSTATNSPGRPIKIGGIGRLTSETAIAITPDGRTAYIADGNHRTVIPVLTATNTPGRPIKVSGTPVAIAITPDGKTAYVATAAYIARSCVGCPVGTLIPVLTATNTPGKPIKIGRVPEAIAITPADGGVLQKLLPRP